jgi:hypothetical protein
MIGVSRVSRIQRNETSDRGQPPVLSAQVAVSHYLSHTVCLESPSPYGQPVDTLPRRFGRASVAAVTARTAGPSEASCRSATCLIPSLPG